MVNYCVLICFKVFSLFFLIMNPCLLASDKDQAYVVKVLANGQGDFREGSFFTEQVSNYRKVKGVDGLFKVEIKSKPRSSSQQDMLSFIASLEARYHNQIEYIEPNQTWFLDQAGELPSDTYFGE